jgi:multiple sugar transport system substrate-binding protein
MSTTDEVVYVPLLFGYSNYARPGFRPHLVRFRDVPVAADGVPRGGILGGAGVAISSATKHPRAAADYAAYVASANVQRGLYFASGGQPGHRAAWQDEAINAAASNFFRDTLRTLDNAYLRPRYRGYPELQERAGEIFHHFLRDAMSIEATLNALDDVYRGSRQD